MKNIETQLPSGWSILKFKELMSFSPKKPFKDNYSDNLNVSFIPMSAVSAETGTVLNYSCKQLGDAKKGYTYFEDGDVLFGKITPCMENGKSAVAYNLKNGFGFGSTEFYVLRPYDCLDAEYLQSFIRQVSFRKKAAQFMTGSAGQKRVPKRFLENYKIPLPPLSEQKRIAKKINTLLVSVNKIKGQLYAVPDILKNFRHSVLSDAFTGRLSEKWRKKSEKQRNQTTISGIGLPQGWDKIRIKDFTSKVGSGATPRGGRKVYVSSGIPLVRSQNIHFERFIDKGLVYISKKHAKELANVELKKNDVLLNITGASIGRVMIAPESLTGARVNQHVCIIRPERLVRPQFLSYFLSSPEMQRHIMQEQYGVTRQALTKRQILDFEIPLPPDKEQKEIVLCIETLFQLADNIECRFKSAIIKINEISQSILSKAFSGELVPTEAEIAKKESRSYETADELLARIKTEREKIGKYKNERKIMKREKNNATEMTTHKLVAFLHQTQSHELSPDQLFNSAGFDENSVDQFYELLRECVLKKQIIETRLQDNRILLEGIEK